MSADAVGRALLPLMLVGFLLAVGALALDQPATIGQQLLNGLVLGSFYGLIAIGYTMVYGIIGMINFAHGEIYMIGSFAALIGFAALAAFGVTAVPLALLLALLFAILVTSVFGFTAERIAYRPLRGSFRLAPLISAIGVSVFLQNFVQVTQGARLQPLPPVGPRLAEALHLPAQLSLLPGLTLSLTQALILVVTPLLMAGTWGLIRGTSFGRAQRACEQDKTMAGLLGIDVDRTISLTFVLGAALAAVAGLLSVANYGVINFTDGLLYGAKAFTAAVLGGIGSLPGAMLGGLLIGLIETGWAAFQGSEYKDVAAFAVLVLVLMVRPTGLLGRPDVEKV